MTHIILCIMRFSHTFSISKNWKWRHYANKLIGHYMYCTNVWHATLTYPFAWHNIPKSGRNNECTAHSMLQHYMLEIDELNLYSRLRYGYINGLFDTFYSTVINLWHEYDIDYAQWTRWNVCLSYPHNLSRNSLDPYLPGVEYQLSNKRSNHQGDKDSCHFKYSLVMETVEFLT